MKNNVQEPLFIHITRVLQCGELHGKRIERINIREGHTFQNIPGNKGDEDQEPAKVKLIALILCFVAV
jgi:hypothetical protein